MPATFLKQFAKNWREVGAVAPSSRFLVEKMLSRADVGAARIVVELGPGTGVLTRAILERLPESARLIVVETNETFCSALRELGDPRVSVECVSAERLSEVLRGEKADIVFSGLPFASLGKECSRRILEAIQGNLAPGGAYVQFQYSKLSRRMIEERFGTVAVDFVALNVPPAFVYTARKAL